MRGLPKRPPVPKRRPDGTWELRWRYRLNGQEHRPKKLFTTEDEATDYVLRHLVAASATSPTSQAKTFDAAADAWLESRRRKGLKPRTVDGYQQSLKHAREFFDGMRLADIRPADADDFCTWLSTRPTLRTPRSVHWAWGPFRATMKHAVARRELVTSPAEGVELPRLVSPRDLSESVHHFLRPAEITALCAELADQTPYDLLVRFTAYTGLRRGEVARLEVRHVTLIAPTGSKTAWAGSVRVEGDVKSAASRRTVPLPGWLAGQMAAYLSEHPRRTEPNAPLWPSRKRGGYTHGARKAGSAALGSLDWTKPLEPCAFYRNVFKPAVRRAGLPSGVRFHDLRHTYASLLAAEGRQAAVVAKLMGHGDGSITLRVYTHLWPEQLDSAVEGLAEPPAAAPPNNVIPLHRAAG